MPAGTPLVNLQVKTSSETLREFEAAYAESECTTKGQFIELIIEAYLNPPKGKTIEVSKKEDQDTIEQLNNEIGRQKIMIDQLKAECIEINHLYTDAKQTVNNLETEIINQKPDALTPLSDQIIITIPPIVNKVLLIEAVTAKKKTGKDFTIGEILTNSFWESVTVGRAFPWRTWSSSELSKIATELKAAQ